MKGKKLWFVANPVSGKAAVKPKLLEIINSFIGAGYDTSVYLTQKAGELPDIIESNAAQYDRIVCCGGDGTLNETINGLLRLENPPEFGYIPAGTTNDFATSFALPKSMVKAAQVAVTGQPTMFDVGRVNDRHFAYVAAFGIFTDVPYQTSQDAKNLLGRAAYVLEGAKRLSLNSSHKLKITYGDNVIEDNFLLGIISNSKYVAGLPIGIMVDASMDDGLLEVILIRYSKNLLDLTPVINSLLRGEIDHKSNTIVTFKTDKLKISCDHALEFTLDGEYGGSHSEVEISTIPKALSLIAPQE